MMEAPINPPGSLEENDCLSPLLNPPKWIYEGGGAYGTLRYLSMHETDYMHNHQTHLNAERG